MKYKSFLCVVPILLIFLLSTALAGVSPQEAAKLKTTLTPYGAERAGNTEGTIPEWTGGIATPPAGYKKGEFCIDPYPEDKILFTITKDNYKKYADNLSDGQKALFEKYPEAFKMNVYPTRRSFAAPQWIYDNTFKNATSSSLAEGGNGVVNAFGGVPYPIPQTGVEVVWNHLMRWQGKAIELDTGVYNVYPGGRIALSANYAYEQFPFFLDKDRYHGTLLQYMVKYTKPERRNGEILLVLDAVNQVETPRQAWQYIPGQRRVRRAPTVAYDTPNGSMLVYDDAYVYNGSPDRYDWKLMGKKEVYIPYNCYKLVAAHADPKVTNEELFTVQQPNPEFFRWELHRVWVVEGTLKKGKRHIYAKRTFYVDEDTWNITLNDRYDARGALWRVEYIPIIQLYYIPASHLRWSVVTDLLANFYGAREVDFAPVKAVEVRPDRYFTPQNVRKLSKR